MIDPFHLDAYNETAVNYNRDVEVFPVCSASSNGSSASARSTSRRRTWASTAPASASWTTSW